MAVGRSRGGGGHGGEEAIRAGQAPARCCSLAGAGRAGVPVLRRVRRLPVSAPGLLRRSSGSSTSRSPICFERIGGFDRGLIAPVVPCPQPYGYRNRIMIRSQWDKFRAGAEHRLRPRRQPAGGGPRGMQDRRAGAQRADPPRPRASTAQRRHQGGPAHSAGGLGGAAGFVLPEQLLPAAETGRSRAQNGCEQARTRILLDLYCGVGFFSIELGGPGRVLCRRGVGPARPSRRRAGTPRLVGAPTASSSRARRKMCCRTLLQRVSPRRATTVLLDPPRKGCQPETLQLLRGARPAQVIYVSCHPATMARDLNVLCARRCL